MCFKYLLYKICKEWLNKQHNILYRNATVHTQNLLF